MSLADHVARLTGEKFELLTKVADAERETAAHRLAMGLPDLRVDLGCCCMGPTLGETECPCKLEHKTFLARIEAIRAEMEASVSAKTAEFNAVAGWGPSPRKARWDGDPDVLPVGMEVEVLAEDIDYEGLPARIPCWIRAKLPTSEFPMYRSCDASDLEEMS